MLNYNRETSPIQSFPEPVIPIEPRGKKPLVPWQEFQNRIPTNEERENWRKNWPDSNVGLVTGRISNVVVLDVDGEDGKQSIKDKHIPPTPCVHTAKGQHYYFKHPGFEVRNFTRKLPGLDLRGDGGYVLVPPSIHPSGQKYEWADCMGLGDIELAEMPSWLLGLIEQKIAPTDNGDPNWLNSILTGVSAGQRNDAAARYAGHLIGKKLAQEVVEQIMLNWNQKNKPPLPEKEILIIVRSIMKSELKKPSTDTIGQMAKEDREPSSQGLKVITVYELLEKTIPPREKLLAPWLLSQGLNMIYAARGIGKTHVALGIAYAVASGGEFLGWTAEKPRKVLLLDGEMPARSLQERISRIVASSDKEPPSPDYLKIITPDMNQDMGMPDLGSHEGQAQIDMAMGETELVIVDNISSLVRTGRENEAEGWLPVQEWALKLRKTGRSVLFVHHAGKSGSSRGTSKREDLLDCVISLKRPNDYNPSEGCRFEVHFEKSRDCFGGEVEAFEAKLQTDEKGGQIWTTKTMEGASFEKVVQLAREGLTQTEICNETGLHKSSVSRHLSRARSEGLITSKAGGGK